MDFGGMLEISIIKVEDPGCLWGQIVKGFATQPGSPHEYEDLQAKMNLFYHDVNLDVQKIKLTALEEGQLCAVFCPTLKSWCRAKMESLFMGTVGSQAMCLLVDYGEHIVVSTDNARALLDKFLKLPFRVRRFELARIHPMRLKVFLSNETAELVPSPHWDTSVTKYLYNLLQVSTMVEAVVCETNACSTAIELYVTIRNVKICVNDDLVVKKFACFSSEKAVIGEMSSFVDRSPISLSWDIFSSPQQILEINGCCTVRSLPPHILSKNVTGQLRLMPSEEKPVTSVSKPQVFALKLPDATGICAVENEDVFNGTVSSGDESTRIPEEVKHYTGNFEQTVDTESALVEQLSQHLNVIRFMKFLNPSYSSHSNSEENPPNAMQTGENPAHSDLMLVPYSEEHTDVCPQLERDEDFIEERGSGKSTSDSHTVLKEQAFVHKLNARDQLSCARLLQFLNPDPINLDTECTDNPVVCCESSKSSILVHSAFSINPCSSLMCAPITDQFRKFLLRRKYSGPSLAENYCWPPVAQGCDTVLVCHSGNDPLSYIPPLLAQLQLASMFNALTSYTGPIAVILCPGWEKVQFVLELLEDSQAAVNLHPAAMMIGLRKDEAKNAKIQNNCQLLVTTPFSLARLLEVHCFQFLRLCHLVMDEASELYSRAPEQMEAILQHFQKVVSREERAMCPRQIVAVSVHWSQDLEAMVREHTVSPSIIVTVPEEAALYGSVHQTVLLCLDCNKTSTLLSSLDFSPCVPQKTIIITNSAEEVEHVYKAVSNTAAFSLKAHEGLTYRFEFVVEQWKKDIGPGTQVILVTTNDCLKALCIRDATCVVHYGFPSSPKLFGNRLFCMSENFQNLSIKDGTQSSSLVVRSVLLLSEKNARHISGVLRYLKRTGTPLPSELLQFAQGVKQAKEEQKIDRELCSHLKSLGFCRDSSVCPDRHMIIRKLSDSSLHFNSGTILVLPLYIKSANVYYGRIVNQKEDSYKTFAAELNSHYAKGRLHAKEVVVGGVYAVQQADEYHRVCVINIPDKGNQLFSSVTAHFIDVGCIQEVKSHQLLELPPGFQSIPSQAVEIILCRVQPIDGEVDWNPRVTRAISLKIKGKVHQAKVVMCLGNTVWVDPMIHMTRVPGLKTFIHEYNVHTEILATGMGTPNPQHLELLKTLCQREEMSTAVEISGNCRFESESVALEQKVQYALETLTSQMKAESPNFCRGAELTENGEPETCEPSEKLTDLNQTSVSSGGSTKASLIDNEQMLKSTDLGRLCTQIWSAASSNDSCKDEIQIQHHPVKSVDIVPPSFHPQIKWFQGEDSVTIKVKLVNPMMQKCEFFSDKVLYSAYVNNRRYCANLELHGNIDTQQSLWEMKCNEPVIKLVKKEKGKWKSLLKFKSAFVCYDFDHVEDEEISSSKHHWFLADTGEEGSYVTSDSGSESD
ncbi:putative ATP-dependent RNA helicase TDRD12 isoform X2 [Hoplias malabaricus]|uniref:putative ATP-dependent RNA helicase TDRD12 isoform X2 n=1 Tax=Hoplias malabaricus TaxID=27720 RepID=UPI0034625C29